MSKPVSTVWKLSSLNTESVRWYMSFSGPSAWASSSCRQSRISWGATSDGMKIAMRSRSVRVVQSVSALRRLRLKSAQPVTRGTTKQAAWGTARCNSARGMVSMVIDAALFGAVRRMSMPASPRRRAIRRSRSGSILGGVLPNTRTVTGPSNRVNTGKRRPDSRVNDRSRKSVAISALLARGRLTLGPANVFIGGRAIRSVRARSCGAVPAGLQAASATKARQRVRARIIGE